MFSKGSRLLNKWKKLPPKNLIFGSQAVTPELFAQLDAVEMFHKVMLKKMKSDLAEAGIDQSSNLWRDFQNILNAYDAKIREIEQLRVKFGKK